MASSSKGREGIQSSSVTPRSSRKNLPASKKTAAPLTKAVGRSASTKSSQANDLAPTKKPSRTKRKKAPTQNGTGAEATTVAENGAAAEVTAAEATAAEATAPPSLDLEAPTAPANDTASTEKRAARLQRIKALAGRKETRPAEPEAPASSASVLPAETPESPLTSESPKTPESPKTEAALSEEATAPVPAAVSPAETPAPTASLEPPRSTAPPSPPTPSRDAAAPPPAKVPTAPLRDPAFSPSTSNQGAKAEALPANGTTLVSRARPLPTELGPKPALRPPLFAAAGQAAKTSPKVPPPPLATPTAPPPAPPRATALTLAPPPQPARTKPTQPTTLGRLVHKLRGWLKIRF